METVTADLDGTIDDLQRIADALLRRYPTWAGERRTLLAAQLMQTALLRECLSRLAELETLRR